MGPMRKKLGVGLAIAAGAAGVGGSLALAASQTTGTNVSCATATLPAHTIGVDGTGVNTIAGTSTSNCNTVTYTIPTSTVTTTVSASGAPGIGACGVSPPGASWTVGGQAYSQAGVDTFTKDQASGAAWSNGNDTTPVYTGDHGLKWVTYPDGWGANGVTPAYQPSTVLSVHDGVLDFNLHNELGASPSPIPASGQNQTYGAWSMCEKVAPDAGSNLRDFKQAILLWPQSDADGGAAESDFPEGNFTDSAGLPSTFMSAFAHYTAYPTQDAYQSGTLDLSQWHVYTQTWGPGFRSYYVDGNLIGTSTNKVWSQPERWQLQVQPLAGSTTGGHGHVYINWVWIGSPASSQTSSSTTSTTTSSTTPTTSTTSTTTSSTTTAAGKVQHVVVIVMENHGPSTLSQMPYLSGLASSGGSATNYFAIGHFSADNYIAMTSGTTCCFDDSFQNLSGTPNIFGQLGSAAQTLSESGGGGYAGRHDPQTYYGLPSSSGKFTDGQSVDLTGKKFTLVVPGLCDDMHDCGPSVGDAWLSRNVPSFTANPGTAVFITFDEDSGSGQGLTTPPNNQVPMIIVSPFTHGMVDATQFNHYSLLRTAEDLLGLPAVGSAASASSMVGHFGLVAG